MREKLLSHALGGEGIPAVEQIWSERYRIALRMGGAKAGKEVGDLFQIDLNDSLHLSRPTIKNARAGQDCF